MPSAKAILLIDENPNDAAFISNALDRNFISAKIGQVTDSTRFVALDSRDRWDVVLVSSRVHWIDLNELLRTVRRRWSDAKIVLVSETADEALATEVMRLGLVDFVSTLGSDLNRVVETVMGALAHAASMPESAESRRLLARTPAGFFRCFSDGRLFDCNDALARMLGFEDRVPAILSNHPFIRAEDLTAMELGKRCPDGRGELRINHRAEKDCWGRIHLWPANLSENRTVGFEGWVQNVTQSRKELEMLREHRDTQNALFDASPIAMAVLGEDGIIRQVNAEFERLAGQKQKALKGLVDYFSFVAPHDFERVKRNHLARIAGMNPPPTYEYDFINSHGETKRVQLTAHFVRSRRYSVVMHIDLTERLRKEKAFRQLAQELAAERPDVLEGLVAGLGLALEVEAVVLARAAGPEWDRLEVYAAWMDGRPLALPALPVADSAFARVVGGRSMLAVCTDKAQATFPVDRWLREAKAEAFVGLPVVSAQGASVGLLWVASRRPLSSIRFFKSVMQIAAQKAATEIAARTRAQDTTRNLGNRLAAILGYCTLAHYGIVDGEPTREALTQAQLAGERAAALTRQLLLAGPEQQLDPKEFAPNEAVAALENLLRRMLPKAIQLSLELGPAAGRIKVDRDQFELILVNLAVNARDAMPDGGPLVIRTCRVTLHDAEVPGLAAGPYVCLSAFDTGEGILPDTPDVCFTTKASGPRPGLGLSIIRKSAALLGGQVTVNRVPQGGTLFVVYLPGA